MWNRTNNKRWGGAVCGLALVLACCVLPSASMACEPGTTAKTRADLMKPIELRPDGSFRVIVDTRAIELVGGSFSAMVLSGGAILNLGEGRTGQKIADYYGCSGDDERLLFVDCIAQEAIIVDGIQNPDVVKVWGMEATRSIAEIQYPKGPIGFTKDTTVPKVEAIAKKHGFSYSRDVYGTTTFCPRRSATTPIRAARFSTRTVRVQSAEQARNRYGAFASHERQTGKHPEGREWWDLNIT